MMLHKTPNKGEFPLFHIEDVPRSPMKLKHKMVENHHVEVGDIVYLYQANPEKYIRYKTVVTSVSNELTISDETPYGGSPKGIPAFEFGITLDY